MQHFLQEITPFVSEYGLIIIFMGMMVEGTAMILLTGLLCYHGVFSIEEAWIAAVLGAIVGDYFWFYIGNVYGNKILNRFPALQEKSAQALSLISSKADIIASFARFIYGGAIIFPLMLGIHNYSKKRYILLDSIGDSLWAVVGIGLGYYAGNGIEALFGKIQRVEHFLFVFAVFILFVIILRKVDIFKK